MRITRKEYEEYLNGLYDPWEAWKKGQYMYKNNQGYIMKYGSTLRRKDPTAFEVGFREWAATRREDRDAI